MGVDEPTTDAPVYKLPGVNIFASGRYRGTDWSPATVRKMAANARLLGPSGKKLHVPPAVPGHENDDGWKDWLDLEWRTDIPAGGWLDPDSVVAVPDAQNPGHVIIKADIVNVPEPMAEKIRSGEYATGSCEVYEDFLDDFGHSFGKTIRRFSYLGSEVPQVKRLGRLPMPQPMPAVKRFSEPGRFRVRCRREPDGSIVAFAESVPVDRTQLIAAIQAAMPNVARATLDALNDDQLADLAKNIPVPAEPTAAPLQPAPAAFEETPVTRDEMIAALTEAGQDPTALAAMTDEELQALMAELSAGATTTPEGGEVTTMGDPATMTREELVAELVAAGQDQAALEAMTDDELKALYAQLNPPADPAAPPVAAMSDRKPKKATPFAELPAVKKLVANATRLNTFAEAQLRRAAQINRETKRQKITAFGEEMVKAGRFLPWQKDIVCSLLHHLDDVRATHRFSEAGKTSLKTPLDAVMAACRKGAPIVRFGEKLTQPTEAEAATAEEDKVRRFAAERLPETVARQYVEKFSELRKKKPSLTAREYGVEPTYA